ncbi:MAG: NADH-ubiquinone oxidoreductase-F iron-sulfur binding region domain-containing protein [Chloroflexota bacterium]|jgi:NADH:ubiquinone oxidoreductase subunit F (NADH-binding)/(2Fe-2S) ferredoxin
MKQSAAEALETLATSGRASLYPDKIKITVGMATCGLAAGAGEVYEAIRQRMEQRGLDAILAQTGCIGYCQKEPLVDVRLPSSGRILYTEVTRPQARALVDALARDEFPGRSSPWAYIRKEEALILNWVDRFKQPDELEELTPLDKQPFFAQQKKIVLRNSGYIDPTSLAEYVARGGYLALANTLATMSPQAVIDRISLAGLRGRGGGGFPTGHKWQVAHDAPGEPKYVICNGDEGDPGAYMDRTVLESDPHSVIEGIIAGAYAIGANQGYIYVRDEYPLAIERLAGALDQAGQHGLLGEDILGSGFSFSLAIIRGAGAFVCGEETAMIASIEGGLGEPRPKPPYPAVSGLWGKPTIINNVKTWATVPAILARGSGWYAALGAPNNAGTVVFSLVGQIANTGLVEVPLGMPLGQLLEEIGGGGIGRPIKAVQTGGPSGGCLPARLFDLPINYEQLKEAGSIMGSGGMVALDESACMVDVARYFLDFTTVESCGKCTACREGNRHLRTILERIVHGQGRPEDLDLLEEVGQAVKAGSLCGLGQTSPNPVLSTLRYFRDEYEAHVHDHRCPAGQCPMTPEVSHA